MTEIVYSIKQSRINQSILEGFETDPKKGNRLVADTNTDYHAICVSPIDGGEINSSWGRLRYTIEKSEDMVFFAYVMAVNSMIDKDELSVKNLKAMGARRFVGQNDILLYDFEGRYLYVAIEIVGEGDGLLEDIRIDKVGDNFMGTFPEIYQDRGSFFHRYMSIFSSIYNDFGDQISSLHQLLNIDTVPAKFLITYGQWLGIDLDCDFKDEEILRTFVKEAYTLNKLKGTKAAISRIAKIILGEDIVVLEKNIMEQYEDESELEQFKLLFGDNVYNICILLDNPISEVVKSQFIYVLKQFIPVRARVQIVNLKREGELDFHSYLDMNAKLFESKGGLLDYNMAMDHAITLQE